MSAYVTFPNGTVVEYNRCHFIRWATGNLLAQMYTKEGGEFIAGVPKDCTVSYEKPSSVMPASIYRGEALNNMLDIVSGCIEEVELNYKNGQRLRKLKEKLRDYNIQRKQWKSK